MQFSFNQPAQPAEARCSIPVFSSLLIDQLKGRLHAEKQLIKVLPKMAGAWYVRLNTDSTPCSGDFSDQGVVMAETRPEPCDGYAQRITVQLPPYSALILSQNPV